MSGGALSGAALRLGLDLGTSALKAVAIDGTGRVVAQASAAYPTDRGPDGDAAEQDPADWLRAAAAAVAAIGRDLGGSEGVRLDAIGLAGQLPTLVALGPAGPLGPAVTWLDGRADPTAAAIVAARGAEALYRTTGMRLDGRYLAPMFRHHHAADTGATLLLSAKDFLCRTLTGRAVTDPSTAAGYALFDLARGAWSADLADLWGIDPALLPAIAPAAAAAGPLGAAGAALLGLEPGIPVGVGAADSVAAAFAMGALGPGTAVVVMGSSTVVLDSVARPVLDGAARYILTPHALEGWWGREMDLLATGAGFRWLAGLFGLEEADLTAAALAAPPGARGVRFAPYLGGGEQGALWDPSLRGALLGLDLAHGPGDIARAFLEGVAFEVRRCLDVLGETYPVGQVVLAGAAAENDALVALFADALARPVTAHRAASPAAIGAALIAPGAAGVIEPSAAVAGSVAPGPGSIAYETLYRTHRRHFPAVAR